MHTPPLKYVQCNQNTNAKYKWKYVYQMHISSKICALQLKCKYKYDP